MSGPYQSSLLNHNLQHCQEKDAVFVEHHYTDMETAVETFHEKYTKAARELAEKSPATPIGEGASGETRQLNGITLTWCKTAWRGNGNGFELEIGPECDKADVEVWMEQFKPIRQRVLARSFEIMPVLKFLIGKEANKIHNRCVAFAKMDIVGFPILEKGHIIAVKTAEASQNTPDLLPVELNTILLHEVGHTLRIHFPELREELVIEMARNGATIWDRLQKLNAEISPHYLAEQHQSILMQLGMTQIQHAMEPNHPDNRKNAKWVGRLAGEIFAETCRVFYLEPVLEGKPHPEIKTGCPPIDNLIHTMCEQAKLTLNKSTKQIPYDGLEVD